MNYELSMDSVTYLSNFNQILNWMGNKMLNPNLTNDITIDFINCMIPHHAAAIYMCRNLLNYKVYEPLRSIANYIIKVQTEGIRTMQNILTTTSGYNNLAGDIDNYLHEYFNITNNMLYEMSNSLQIDDINLDFISEMIPHHQGAIAMCQNVLQYNIDPRLRNLANSIIKEQSRGIRQLENIKSILIKR